MQPETEKMVRNDKPEQEKPPMLTVPGSAKAITATSTSAGPAEDPVETNSSDVTFDPEKDTTSQSILMQFVEDWMLALDCKTLEFVML